ncbi:hypothetical protein [Haliscomenobacter hydrossis]|uniref:Uncharacterized protein n=1 Tax=Haliscomenobacter hydrossis (strain ATCC 27775 / DSM 1100 / LMG 10767 / O) TaxID=760192 RepID=F4L833_HALH1|nr:hypothetical protein [Haliscomenobacter hydrossis]AEE54541.1 hypothetical protein Halhy_6726 [Haliscomenobacter hydrossis DSM 1100]
MLTKMINKLELPLIQKAFDALINCHILHVADKKTKYPVDTKDYVPICSDFIYNVFNIGLLETCLYFEKNPTGSDVEQKRATFCKALFYYITGKYKGFLSNYVEEIKTGDMGKLQHEIKQAVDYFKLAIQVSQPIKQK